MKTIYEKTFTQERYYGQEIQIMDMLDGEQVFVFYTISSNQVQAIGMFEILLDERVQEREVLVIDYGELDVPVGDEQYNYGPLNIGGGKNYLLTFFDKFSFIKGYTMCDYTQIIEEIGSTKCVDLAVGVYSLDPWGNMTASCGDSITNANEKSKLEYVCNAVKFEADTFFIVVLVIVSIGITCCCISNILFCKFRTNSHQFEDMPL